MRRVSRSTSVGAVLAELRLLLTRDPARLAGMALNLALALGYLALTRYHPQRPVPIRITGVGVAVVVWVLADVANTNQLGADAERVARRLAGGVTPLGELRVKNLALALLLVPVAAVVSTLAQLLVDDPPSLLDALLTDAGAVFVWLGVGSVMSVLLPYRPLPWRTRRARPGTWPYWALCLGAPYAVAVVVMPLLHLPVLLVDSHPPSASLVSAGGYLVLGLVYWALGLAAAARLARWERIGLARRL